MMSNKKYLQLAAILYFFFPSLVAATVITTDTVWQGEVTLTDDVLVPKHVSLIIKPGTIIKIIPAESTKTDPEYLSPLTEITIRGRLEVEGTSALPVVFYAAGETKTAAWAGIIVDGGEAVLSSCRITDADAALYVIAGTGRIIGSDIRQNRYGISAIGSKSTVTVTSSVVADNDYGVLTVGEAKVIKQDSKFQNNRKKDHYTAEMNRQKGQFNYVSGADLPVSRIYGDEVLLGNTVWQGHIVVKGIIRVPEGARLAIMPGAIIEFAKRDTNSDGIGENGLLIQGLFLAKGNAKNPIVFRSAEKSRQKGDWDAINIMNSDGAQNLIEYCQIEDAYRGLHFHYSNVAVTKSVLKNNYRGIQFQESSVILAGNWLHDNKSGIQGRNSTIEMTGNIVADNYMGGNFFRSNMQIKQNRFLSNLKEGLRLREGVTIMEENLLDGNRYGLMVADTFSGSFRNNVVTNNFEIGFSLKNSDNIDLSKNFFVRNGFNGLSIQETRADIEGNQFTANGERGIGMLSFTGLITGNNFMDNQLYAIDQEGKNDVDAPANWWGGADPTKVIFDHKDDSARGSVNFEKALTEPVPFVWPLPQVVTSTEWSGSIVVKHRIEVTKDATISIMPDTKIAFSEGTGLSVYGKVLAKGEKSREIVFTSLAKKEAGAWDEVLLEHAKDSVISHATFEYANWGLHSHFTNLSLSDSRFRNNVGGMRFRSGPIIVRSCLFSNNSIGIRSYRGNGTIEKSNITNNEVGIFVREKGGGLKITKSNLSSNSSYNIRIGDFNDENVNAKGNWWGGGNPGDTIFDGLNEPGIGFVRYEPFLQKPLTEGLIK